MRARSVPFLILALMLFGNALGEGLIKGLRLELPESSAQPSKEEFILAAKKTFYRRNLEFEVISDEVVRGTQKDYAYEIRREGRSFRIVWVGGEIRIRRDVDRHVRGLARDFKYELAEYLL